jgi:hypothetical protein
VEAIQWTGKNKDEFYKFINSVQYIPLIGISRDRLVFKEFYERFIGYPGDYIVKDVNDEIHIVSEGVFEETFEKIED